MATVEPKRTAQDLDDRRLFNIGWEPAGIALYEYPLNSDFRGFYTKEQAVKLTEENGLDLYCPLCGSCGEEGCCRPEKCKCFYSEHYNKTYRELLDEHEAFYQLAKAIADTSGEYDINDQVADAQRLLKEFGYESE